MSSLILTLPSGFSSWLPALYWLKARTSRAMMDTCTHRDNPPETDVRTLLQLQILVTFDMMKEADSVCLTRYVLCSQEGWWLSHLECRSDPWHGNVCPGSTPQIFKLTFTGHYRHTWSLQADMSFWPIIFHWAQQVMSACWCIWLEILRSF